MAGQIQPFDIVAPGRRGLNTEAKNTLLAPTWATQADNAVINRAGRIAARAGWADQTANPIASTPKIDVMHEYLDAAGAVVIISTAGNKIYKDIDDFTDAANDITSATAPTADHWQFVNFNGKVLGFQRGHAPIGRTTGDFADATYTGTGPDGNCAVAAFGRVWAADADLQTVRYSALLDDTDYSTGSGGGTLDMRNLWTGGMDEIVAIAALGAMLIVFGKNHIILWADGSGSEIGITANQLEVVDTIEGTGCIARDSIVATGEGDLLFLSRHGVQSLARVIEQKTNPIITLSKNVRDDLLSDLARERAQDTELDAVRATHSPEQGLYILNFPFGDKQYVFDTHHKFQDDDGAIVFPVTKWMLGGSIGGLLSTTTGDLYFGSAGVVGKYSGNIDNASDYIFTYKSGWLDMEGVNHKLKMLKEFTASVAVGAISVTYTWQWDFLDDVLERTFAHAAQSDSEFNVAEFNLNEFSGGVTVQRKTLPAHGEGQFLRLGVYATISSSDLVIQALSVAPKLGRSIT